MLEMSSAISILPRRLALVIMVLAVVGLAVAVLAAPPGAAGLQVRNLGYSASRDGPPLDPPEYDCGDDVYYRMSVSGVAVKGNRCGVRVTCTVLDPDGEAVVEAADQAVDDQRLIRRGADFELRYAGHVRLPDDAISGTYRQRFTVHDLTSNQTINYDSTFEVR